MEKGMSFLLKKLNYDSGVKVSVQHLCHLLEEEQIPYEVLYYEDDAHLLELAENAAYSCLDFHVPSFQDETLRQVLQKKENVVLSIHSTMCNLQVEENSLQRMLTMGDGSMGNLRFTCPSKREVDGFNAIVKAPYLYMPNTFSYATDGDNIVENIRRKADTLESRPVKISLISAYRPMKNMIIQMAAIAMLAKEKKVELHLVDSGAKTPVYHNVLKIAEENGLKIVMHPQTSNYELFHQFKDFDIGMQVSLTETFSYVAFEHMIQGVPVIGSHSVPFASEVVDYSDVNSIYLGMKKVLADKATYEYYAHLARKTALNVGRENKQNALATIRALI